MELCSMLCASLDRRGVAGENAAAAAAKSHQSCPTLCDPIDGSPPGSSVPGILAPGKNTGVGCHFLLQCMKVKSESEVSQSGQTLCDPMDCNLPGSSIHGISQARVLEWGAIAFSGVGRMDTCICITESLRCSPETTTTLLIDYQFSSVAQFCPTLCDLWTAACQASLSFTIFWSLLKLMLIKLVMPSNYLILCCPLLLLPSIFPSIRVFSNESVLRIRWQKYWSFSFSISPSSEYSGLISFRTDWFDLLAVRGTLKNLLQYHSSKASVLRRSVLFRA